jgi:Subtilase family
MNEKFRDTFSGLRSRLRGIWQLSWPYKLAGGVVAAGLIFALLPQSLFHSFRCESFHIRQNFQASRGFFVDEEVVVLGTQEDVNTVIGTHDALGNPTKIGLAGVSLNLVENCDLSYLNTRKSPDPKLTEQQRKQLVMQLFEIPDGSSLTVESAVSLINSARGDNPNKPEYQVFADPNYLTSLLDSTTDTCSEPNGGGSGGGGKDFGGPGVLDPKDNPSRAFIEQWALGSQGIDAHLPSSLNFTGHEVHVGVFDTSPFRTSFPSLRRIRIALPLPLWITTGDATGATMASNHGLFVASLIHRLAPKSAIQLIRVLNDDGCGESLNIAKAIHAYTSRMSAWEGDLDENVINLSLGLDIPNETEETDNPSIDWGLLQGNSDNHKLRSYSLEEAINEADRKGAIIVAAAGNESNRSKNRVAKMLFPAQYGNVWGVAATNTKGEISCYSNNGDIAAPGGDGGPGIDKDGLQNACVPRASTWNTDQNPCQTNDVVGCNYGLIGLGITQNGPQYIYWAGSSFATPLVSGLAALAYEERSKDQANCLISNGTVPLIGATAPDAGNIGVINISNSFSSAVIAQCQKLYPSDE